MLRREVRYVCLLLIQLVVDSNCQELPNNCSVAFYPLTACNSNGDRSAFVQFDYCNEMETRLSFAWFGITPIDVNVRTIASRSLPDNWKEVVIPNSKRKNGKLTVFHKRENQESFKSVQILIPSCEDMN